MSLNDYDPYDLQEELKQQAIRDYHIEDHGNGHVTVGKPSPLAKNFRFTGEDNKTGYHLTKIVKGIYGEPSKIQEELDELIDALNQKNRIMALVELSDLYGALKALAENMGTSMDELKVMSEATDRAFKNGTRVSKD